MRIAITGITSGVGVRLAEVALARGDAVVGLARDPGHAVARRLEELGARLVPGDVEDPRSLRALADGADVVVHAAAVVGDAAPRELFERVNVGGTRSAVEAAADARARRFVHVSSSAVYGRPDHGRVTEAWPTRKIGLPYEDTKTEAERLAFERGRELGLEVTAVRPPIIYGPNDRNFLPRAIEALKKRRFLLVDGGRAPLNLVWVDHVVDVVLRAAEHPDAAGEAFNVMDEVDREPPSVREVAEAIAREAGLPAPTRSLPYPVAMGVAHAVAAVARRVRPGAPPPISPFVVKLMTRHVIYDASKAARVLGFVPRVGSLEGVGREARAFAARPRPR
ncbi:MAG TPA: NAD-dependent epimerase/dehydratase family protein [Minicystis sp.]|nr:NAD-dependent epimerase/dehydratase family protein [Minicystis sp.]